MQAASPMKSSHRLQSDWPGNVTQPGPAQALPGGRGKGWAPSERAELTASAWVLESHTSSVVWPRTSHASSPDPRSLTCKTGGSKISL